MKPTLLVLAAGMGSRYGGVKQIDEVGKHGECLLDFSTFDAKKSGYGKVVYIIRKDIEKDFRERLFDRVARNFNAEYVFQTQDALLTAEEAKIAESAGRKKPWGTIHAVLCAKEKINEPFAVINADDYYGRSGIETLGKYLASIENDCSEHAMVGYVLGKTMSRNGSVSRGVCETEGGYLKSIVENTKISYRSQDSDDIISELDGKKIPLSGKETVSMNLFGFSPKAFQRFEAYWDNFKKTSLPLPTAEALLPVAASDIIKYGEGKIKVFTSEENWFGMTYPEDKTVVKSEIAKKIESGYYPEKLWEK
ncbi:MAG: hypothetical protein II921_06930 [Treponema sp.]|nr:hypothetical protein [Treponema sp.]